MYFNSNIAQREFNCIMRCSDEIRRLHRFHLYIYCRLCMYTCYTHSHTYTPIHTHIYFIYKHTCLTCPFLVFPQIFLKIYVKNKLTLMRKRKGERGREKERERWREEEREKERKYVSYSQMQIPNTQ